jgi:hypothetical protein
MTGSKVTVPEPGQLQSPASMPAPAPPKKPSSMMRVLPFRLEADLVSQLDAAWRRQGLRSRTELFRRALQDFLGAAGEGHIAALLALEVAARPASEAADLLAPEVDG